MRFLIASVSVFSLFASACGGKSSATDAGSTVDVASDTTSADSGGDGISSGDVSSDSDAGPPSLLSARSLRFTEDMTAAWGSDREDVWWVGKGGRVLHWNGKTLTPRDIGTHKDLYGVWGRSASEVYVVGDGVILRWDGSSWHDETPDTPSLLRSVHVPFDKSAVVACGDGGVILRRNEPGVGLSGKWSAEDTGSKINLNGIWAQNASQIWAVGDQGRALKLSGGLWAETDMPGATSRVMRAISGSADGHLFACGDSGYLAVTDDSNTWQHTLANDGDSPRDLHGIWGRSATDAWAIGSSGALLHLSGKKWQVVDIAGTYMKSASFLGLFGADDSNGEPFGYAVGVGGAGLTFSAAQPDSPDDAAKSDRWLDFVAETQADLKAVQNGDGDALIACGTGGVVLYASDPGAVFADLAAPVTGADIADCTLVGDTAWVVLPGGWVARGTGVGKLASATWNVSKISGAKTLNGISKFAGGALVIVGDGGFIAHSDNASSNWSSESSGVQFDLRSVSTAGEIAYAVGKYGVALRRDSSGKWSKESTGNLSTLSRVTAWGDGEAAAVSEEGVVLVRGAGVTGAWKQVSETPGQLLYGIARRADGLLLAVGYAGTLVTGQSAGPFADHPKNVPNLLTGVACTSKGCIAVGQKGGIFHVAEVIP